MMYEWKVRNNGYFGTTLTIVAAACLCAIIILLLVILGWSVNISIISWGMISAAIVILVALCFYLYTPPNLADESATSYDNLRQVLHESGALL